MSPGGALHSSVAVGFAAQSAVPCIGFADHGLEAHATFGCLVHFASSAPEAGRFRAAGLSPSARLETPAD
jgi:hypothetical protein